ncbi:MAG: 30S ribosomal protein S2 [Candidatus Taylorbacteria bacterium]|nr:30S ribosomal protein S2 [Candidatus Taylorbacteria bacterium]
MEIKETAGNTQIDSMFKAGAHFGFAKSRRHPTALPYIFGVKNKVEIFDLEQTNAALEKAKEFVKKIASEGKQIIFVGGKNEAQEAIKTAALSLSMPFVAGRWIGGTLTNFTEIKKRIEKFESLTLAREKGELIKYTKKERLLIDREIANLDRFFSGLVPMKAKPAALFVIDSKKEKIAVKEATEVHVPVIALSGSDCNLDLVQYPIPANDASLASIKFFIGEIVKAYKEGQVSAATAAPKL